MATTYAIPDGRVAMAATTYTGNGGTQAVSNAANGVSMQPDFVWVKSRSNAYNHLLYDSIRGAGKALISNSTSAEGGNSADLLGSFNSNGFSVNNTFGGGSDPSTNGNASTFVGWQWKAGGTAVSNTAGSITSSVSANTTAGFSVVTYTGTGANATVGHGLGVAPSMIIVKNRSSAATAWLIGFTFSGFNWGTDYFQFDTSAKRTDGAGTVFTTTPSSTVFSIGSNGSINGSTANTVAYCFAPVAGYSAFGSYTGNGSANGPFVYLGFRPRFLMIKRSDSTGDWLVYDTSRDTYNVMPFILLANSSAAESSGNSVVDALSNGFKLRNTFPDHNASGGTYIYMAFAENPFKYANAR